MRPEKELLLNEIKDRIDHSKAFILIRYQQLNPNVSNEIRTSLDKVGGSLMVTKKTLFKKAAELAGIPLHDAVWEGHVGVVFASKDPIDMIKIACQYQKENNDLVDIALGYIDGQVCSTAEVEMVSKLPSKDQMRSELLSVLTAPLSQTLGTMDSLLTSIIHCVENKASKA